MKLRFALPEWTSFWVGVSASSAGSLAYAGSLLGVLTHLALMAAWCCLRFNKQALDEARRKHEIGQAYLEGRYKRFEEEVG